MAAQCMLTSGARSLSRVCACHAHAGACLCNGAAMKLRLIEQACGCSMMGGGDELKVYACLCLQHFGVK